MCARLSPTGISHHNLLPHFPSIRLSAVNSSPRPGIAPWSLNFSSKPLRLPGDLRPCPGYVWLWTRTVWFSCHLGSHRLAVSLSALYVSPLRQVPRCGDWTPVSVPPLAEGRFSPTNTLVFPSHSFVLPSFVWFYLFFSSGKVLLSTLSWCSACTSVSEDVLLVYQWRRLYSMSTYSSTILFSVPYSTFCLYRIHILALKVLQKTPLYILLYPLPLCCICFMCNTD